MTYCGNPARGQQYKRTFQTLVILTLTYWTIWFFFHCPDGECDRGRNQHHQHHQTNIVMRVTNIVWITYTTITLIKLRRSIRQTYKIPETACHGCEDCCCVLFCSCCTLSQMARQTADYNQRRALCCSDTGLPEDIPIETTLIV
jgi:Cys-rich protein (TIGR01571 family)